MKKLITFLCVVLWATSGMKAQFALTNQTVASSVELVTCGLPDTIQFTLTNTSGGTISNDSVNIVLPTGVTLVSVFPGTGYTATPTGIFISSIANSSSVIVKYLLSNNCASSSLTSIKPNYVSKTPAQTIIGIEYLSSLAIPVLQLTGINVDTSGVGQGSVYTRQYKLTNSSADGRSYFTSLYFQDKLQTGLSLVELKIGSTIATPTISGDTIKYTITGTELSSDSKLNASESITIYEKVRVSNICNLVNTESSAILTRWGCSNLVCETKTTTATAQKGLSAPRMWWHGATRRGFNKCVLYDTFDFKYFNRGDATAYNVLGVNGIYGGDLKAIYSSAIAEVLVSFDNGATYQNIRTSPRIKNTGRTPYNFSQLTPLFSSGQYPTNGDSIVKDISYTIDSLNAGDTCRVMLLSRRLCPANTTAVCGTNDQWGNNKDYTSNYSLYIRPCDYKDYCGTAYWENWTPGGYPSFGNTNIQSMWNVSYTMPTDVTSGNNFSVSVNNSGHYFLAENASLIDNTWYYMYEMTLPTAIQPKAGATKSDFYHIGTGGHPTIGACDSFSYNSGTGKLQIFFFQSRMSGLRYVPAGSITANLRALCPAGQGSSPAEIGFRSYYFNGCGGCGLNIASCYYKQPIQIHCPVQEPTGGIDFSTYDYYRTSYGPADYNNDGFPDGTGPAARDSAASRRFIPGDTLEIVSGGKVYNVTPGQYPYGYAYNTFVKNDLIRDYGKLQNFGATLYIKDIAAGLTYSTTLSPTITITTATSSDSMRFRYNISQDSIRGKGTIPTTYNYKNGDSVYIKTRYRFMDNAEHPSVYFAITPFNLNNQLYLSGVANTDPYKISDTANVESNDQWYGKIEQVFVYSGYRYTEWVPRNVCNNYFEQTSTWGEINGNTYFDLNGYAQNFPKEIKQYIGFKNVYKKISTGWKLDTSAATGGVFIGAAYDGAYPSNPQYRLTLGTHYTYNEATSEVNIDMQKAVDAMHGMTGFVYDEGRAHNIQMFLKKCAATQIDPMNQSPNGLDSLNAYYVYPDIPLTGYASNSLATGFTIINTGANNTQLIGGAFSPDYEPKINVQVVGASTIVAKTANTTADIKLINERYDATYAKDAPLTWIKVVKSPTSKVIVDSILNVATGVWIKPDTLGVFRTASLNIIEEKTYRLAVRFTGCVNLDSIQLRTSYVCPCAAPSDTGLAQSWTTLKFQRLTPQLEIINTVNPNTGIKLCDTIRLSSIINNAGSGRAYNVNFSFQMPNGGVGITPVAGQYRLYFPANSNTFINLPNPTTNGTGLYKWDSITKYIANLDTGGLRDFSDTSQSKFKITMKILTSCGFISGEDMRMFANEPCGPPVEDKATLPLKLAVEDKVASNLYSINANVPTTLNGCGSTLQLTTVFSNLNTSLAATGSSDSIIIILPKGFDHVSTSTAPKRDTTYDGKVRLKWSVLGVTPGNTRTFVSTLSYVSNKLSCSNSTFDIRATTRFTDTCILDGSLCSVEINKDRKELSTTILKPTFTITSASATSIVNPSNSAQESITATYTLSNTGDTSTAHTMKVYHDANADGLYTSGETLLSTQARTVTINPNGSYTYSFTFNVAAGTACPLVLVLDTSSTCMCAASVSKAISLVPFANGGSDVAFCSGASSTLGQVGPGSYLYSWNPNIGVANPSAAYTTITKTNTSTTIDSVFQYVLFTTRTGGGCVTSDTVNVTVKRLPVTSASNDTTICSGTSVTMTATGGATYSWSTIPVKTTASITEIPVTGTNYFVTITGSNGCSRMDTVAVGLKASPTANAGTTPVTRLNCVGDSIQIGTTAVSGITYAWSPSTGLSATNVAQPWSKATSTTTYTLTVTNANGCSATSSVTVNVTNSSLTALAGVDKEACQNSTAINLGNTPGATGGTSPYTYAWTPSTSLTNATTATPTASTAIVGAVDYILLVTDAKGCIARDTAKVTINALPTVTISSSPSATICSGASTTLTAAGASGTAGYTYNWGSTTNASNTVSPTSATTYNVTVTDNKGCTVSGSQAVSVNSNPTANAGSTPLSRVNCAGDSVQIGTAAVSGMTYAWSPSTGLSATNIAQPWSKATSTTTYTLTVTNANGCTATASSTINVTSNTLVAYAGADKGACQNTSSVMLGNTPGATGGTSPYTYAWTPSASLTGATTATPSASTAAVGSTDYILVVSDTKGCIARDTAKVTINALPTVSITSSPSASICSGSSTTLTAAGAGGTAGYTYNWVTTTNAANTVSPTSNTTYNVTVTDSKGCTVSGSQAVTVNALPTANAGSTPLTRVNCAGDSVQIGTAAVSGMTYAWSPSTGLSSTNIAQPWSKATSTTTYTLTVTNANGCTATASSTINVTNSNLVAFAGADKTACKNSTAVQLGNTPVASGGSTPYSYAWTPSATLTGATTFTPSASTATVGVTNYVLSVTDAKGCSTTDTVKVTIFALPTVSITSNPSSTICGGTTTTLTATAANGTAGYTYNWGTTSNAANTVSPTSTNTYNVTVTDTNSCTVVGSQVVTVNTTPVVAITSPSSAMCQGQTRALTATSTVTTGTGVFSGTGVSGSTFTASSAGTFTITYTFTSSAGCIGTTTQSITVNPSPVVNAGANDTICFGSSKVLTGSQTTSLTGLTYEWYMQGSTTPIPPTGTTVTVTPTATSNYIFIATTSAGCSSSDTMNLGIINKPDLIDDMTTCQSATEDVTATIPLANLTTNDNNTAVIKGGITYTVLTPKHGTASLSGTNIIYLANTNYNGKDTIQLVGASSICSNLKDTAIFCINIAAVNDTPVAKNDTATTTMGTAVTKNLLTNDSDVDNTLTGSGITILSGPTHGSLGTIDAAGNVTYTPNANFVGIDTVMYKVCDAGTPPLCDTAYAYFNVTPKVLDTTTTTAGNTTTPIVVGPSLGTVSTATVSGPTHSSGTATIDPMTGAVTFTPSSTPFIGKDTVVRIVGVMTTNGMVYDTSLIIINNAPINDTLRDTTMMNTPIGFPKPSPIVFEGTPLAPVLSPTLTLNADGTVTYTPKPGFVGIDTARLVRCDDKGNCHTTVYIVTVTPNYADTAVMTPQGTPISIASPVTLYPGQSLNTTVLNPTDNGTTTINPDGSITYTPNPSFVGRDTIVRVLCVYDTASMLSFCDTITTIFVVTPKVPDTGAITFVGTPVTGGSPVTKLPGQSVTVSTNGPSNGTATVNPDGTITYTPKPGFVGKDTVKRIVCTYDSVVKKTTCDTSLIIFTVLPKPADVNVSTNVGTPVTGGTPITTYPGTSTTISTAGPSNGTATVNPDGTITYTPKPGFVGKDTVKRIVCVYDSMTKVTLCDTSLIIVTTLPPTLIHYDSTDMNKPVTLVGFSNPDFIGSKPFVTITSSAGSTVTIGTDGKPNYTPKPDFLGVDTIRITRCDSLGNCVTDIYIVTVSTTNFEIPNYFSPNGDGVDDNFALPAGLYAKYPNLKLTIYNRWGNIVWRSTGKYTNNWHGQSLGSELPVPDGVYYYLIEFSPEFKETKTGFVEVMRQ